MTIEVFFCEKGNKLVRGVQVKRKEIANGMVEYTASCPEHPTERLKKIDLPHSWTPTSTQMIEAPDSDIPYASVPANPGTIDEPSPSFWEVMTKAVMLQLPEKAKGNAAELVVLAWQNELSSDEKQELLDHFARTGTVSLSYEGRKNPEQVIDITPPKESGLRGKERVAIAKLKQEFAALEIKIHNSEVYLMGLIDNLEVQDLDAAKEIDFDLFSVARIVGYKDYPKDMERRAELLKQLEEVEGPDALSKIL
jgi:hypothetical protein